METLIVETQKITKGALKAIKEGLEDEKKVLLYLTIGL